MSCFLVRISVFFFSWLHLRTLYEVDNLGPIFVCIGQRRRLVFFSLDFSEYCFVCSLRVPLSVVRVTPDDGSVKAETCSVCVNELLDQVLKIIIIVAQRTV
jgi:hypothetical protein